MVRPYTIKQAADEGRGIRVQCRICGRRAQFIAADLRGYVRHPNKDVHYLKFRCRSCNRTEMAIKVVVIDPERDRGKLFWRPQRRDVIVWEAVPLR